MKWNRQEVARSLGAVGVACVVAGLLRYSIQNEWLRASEILCIGGAVILVASIALGFKEIAAYFTKRSAQQGSNTLILSLAVLAILGFLNFLGFRHSKRFDLTTEKLYSVSDQTQKVVGGLKQDVTVVRFARPQDQSQDSQNFTDLMVEYKHLSPHFKYQEVNPQEKPEIAQEYGAKHYNDVVVASGTQKIPLEGGIEGAISESDVTNAILKATRDTTKKICFITGHGEKSLDDSGVEGYAQMAANLKKETYTTDTINLVSGKGVPSDCDVVVDAGPTKPFFPQEASDLQKYLDDGGKLLLEIDPDTDPKLDAILSAWNIKLGNNVVIDASGMGQLLGTGPEIPLVVTYGDSPITKTLARQMTYFPIARTVNVADKSKEPAGVELLMTSPQSFTKPKLEHQVKYDPKTDQIGPLSLGVAVSEAKGDKSARLVVIGDSDFAENQVLGGPGADGDLFQNIINWLAQDENLISIRPKPESSRHITLTLAQSTALAWIERLFLPGIVIVFGIAIWWKRR